MATPTITLQVDPITAEIVRGLMAKAETVVVPKTWTLIRGKMPCPDWETIYAETSRIRCTCSCNCSACCVNAV